MEEEPLECRGSGEAEAVAEKETGSSGEGELFWKRWA